MTKDSTTPCTRSKYLAPFDLFLRRRVISAYRLNVSRRTAHHIKLGASPLDPSRLIALRTPVIIHILQTDMLQVDTVQ